MADGIQVDLNTGIVVRGIGADIGDFQGIGVTAECCICECGCPITDCFPIGSRLKATITDSTCPALIGIVKYFTKETPTAWKADQDTDPADSCLFLNDGINPASYIYCDVSGDTCGEGEHTVTGCQGYYMELHAYECGGGTVCADPCTCDPFSLTFADIELDGGPFIPPSGPPVLYRCGCSCTFPALITFTVEQELHCCCQNFVQGETPRTLTATIVSAGDEECPGTMEGASVQIESTLGTCDFTNTGVLAFQCSDGEMHYFDLTMTCDSEGAFDGECCSDYEMTISANAAEGVACDPEVPQTAGVYGDCECVPANIKFGPFHMWVEV